jgi:pimeloyl-ACP methyl ester carboxylesterase
MPKLILLPGMDGTGELFGPFLNALRNRFNAQVIRYPTDRALGYEALSTFVRNALPVDEAYVVLAESFSGPIAIAIAAEAPPGLKGLILCCTFARNPRPGFARAGMFMAGSKVPAAMLTFALLGRFGSESLCSALAKAVGEVPRAVMRERLRAVITVDVSAMLRRVSVPCMYLRASEDRVVPARASAHIKACLPATKMVRIEAPHCLLQAAPDEAERAVSSFMRDL